MRTVAFCEIEPYCRDVLARHWPNVPCAADVRMLSRDVLELCGIERVDVICGGFPCQDISLAGNGEGLTGARSGLWFEFFRLIEELRPRYALIENVSALRARGLETILGQLASIGFDAQWHCIPACAVGAPHRRDRIWIVATDAERDFLRQQSGRRSGANGSGATQLAEHGEERFVADADLNARYKRRQGDSEQSSRGGNAHRGAEREDFSDADRQRQQERPELDSTTFQSRLEASLRDDLDGCRRAAGWLVEPDVGRVADGVPARVDRLRCLGNAVVPQIPEILGRAIMRLVNDGR
jgi:DNA (cytosine-5)-methyltransferase 1